jgi:CRP-like cAMP-binding protein
MSEQADEKLALFSSAWLFSELPAETIAQLLRYVRTASYRSNQIIFSRNDPGTSMMVVAAGRVKIRSKSWDGREVVFNLIERGEVFGEIALLDGRERTADAVAMGPTVLLVLERRDFLPVVRRNAEVGVRLLDVLCQRLRRTSQQVEDLLFLEHPARLAKTLLWLAKRYGAKSRDGVAIELKLSQRELGTFVGVRREAMNRQLSNWRTEGLISVKAGLITIPDIAAFEALAEGLGD